MRLKASSDATSSSLSSSKCQQLNGLQDLHDGVDKLLLLPNLLAQEKHSKLVDELLDGSLRLLDACSVSKDSMLQTKHCAQDLQSIMQRRYGGDMKLITKVKTYMASEKLVKNAMHKALTNLKVTGNKYAIYSNENVSICHFKGDRSNFC